MCYTKARKQYDLSDVLGEPHDFRIVRALIWMTRKQDAAVRSCGRFCTRLGK